MKRIYILFLFLASLFRGYTQNYIPLLNENLYWDVAYYDPTHICGYSDDGPRRFFIENDTVIENKTYHRFGSYKMSNEHDGQPKCPPFLVDTLKQLTNIYLREDVVNQQVYRYDDYEQQEVLLLIFL